MYGWFVEFECEVVRAIHGVTDGIRSGYEHQPVVVGAFQVAFDFEFVLAFFAVEGDCRLVVVVVVGGQFRSRLLPRHYGVH